MPTGNSAPKVPSVSKKMAIFLFMKNEDRILTRHPQGKKGVNILREKYEQVKAFILAQLQQEKEMSFEALTDLAERDLTPRFEGKVLWYLVTVKLDLEARGLIERVPKTSPHRLRLVKN